MIDLNDYDNEGKKEVLFNEEEELISKPDKSSLIENEAEESENENNENEEENLSEKISEPANPYYVDENADIGDLLAQEVTDNEKINKINELLFCCQGIGKFIIENGKKIYKKNEYCIPSLKDIRLFLEKDDKETQISKRAILNWKIVESDIIPCLLFNQDDEKICKYCLVLLVYLTEDLDENVIDRKDLEFKIAKLNEIIINSELLDYVNKALNENTKKLNEAKEMKEKIKNGNLIIGNNNVENLSEEEKKKNNELNEHKKRIQLAKIAEIEFKSKDMIELIFIFLKQILSITNNNSLVENSKLCSSLLIKFTNLKLYDALLYYLSTLNDAQNFSFTSEKLAPHLFCILFDLTKLFLPKKLIELSKKEFQQHRNQISENDSNELKRLYEIEQQEKSQRKMLMSSRPNTFACRIQITRPIDNSIYYVNNLNQLLNKNSQNYIKAKNNTFKNQLRKKKQKNTLLKNKKLPIGVVLSEIKLINDTKIKNYFSEKSNEISSESFNETIITLINFFVNVLETDSFNNLMDHYYYKLGKQEELEKYDLYYLINIINFFTDFNRQLNYSENKEKEKEKKEKNENAEKEEENTGPDFPMKRVGYVFTPNMVNYLYNFIYEQLLTTDKLDRKNFCIFPIINYFKQCVYALMDSYRFSKNNSNVENDKINLTINVMLQDSLLTKDYTKIIEKIFELYNEQYHPKEFLYDIIEFCEIYFSALEYFIKKRDLTIKTRKHKRKKRKTSDDDEELQFKKQIEFEKKYKVENMGEGFTTEKKENEKNFDLVDDDSEDSSEDNNNYEIINRNINVNDESKCLVKYDIIEKILSVFKSLSGGYIDNFDLSKILMELNHNNRGILKYISKLFERIAIKTGCSWIFYNIEYLVLFNQLANDPYFNNELGYKSIKDTIEKILKDYFDDFKKNKMLPIECLFHFEGISLVNSIKNNYEYVDDITDNKNYYGGLNNKNDDDFIDNDGEKKLNDSDDEEYYKPGEDNFGFDKKEKDNEKNNNDEKNKIGWNKEADMKLINYYFENINEDKTNIEEIVKNLKEKELNSIENLSENDIKHRLHKLRVRKGKTKAMKKYNKIYNINNSSKENTDNKKNKNNKNKNKSDNNSVIKNIYNLSETAKSPEFLQNLHFTFDNIISQIESYKKKIEIIGNENSENKFEIIPTTQTEISILKNEDFIGLLLSLGFYFNENTEYYTLNSNLDLTEFGLIIENINLYKKLIDENIDQDNEIRNEQKEKYNKAQIKKHHGSKKLKDYIMTEEEVQKEKEKLIENNNLDTGSNDSSILKEKKKDKKTHKKKLIKKNISSDLNSIKEEDDEQKSKQSNKKKNNETIEDRDIEMK